MLIWNWMMLSAWACYQIFLDGLMISCFLHHGMIWRIGWAVTSYAMREIQFTLWALNLNIKHVSRFVLKNAEIVEDNSNLGPGNRKLRHKANWQIGFSTCCTVVCEGNEGKLKIKFSTCCTCPRCGAWRHRQWREGTLPKLELGQPNHLNQYLDQEVLNILIIAGSFSELVPWCQDCHQCRISTCHHC